MAKAKKSEVEHKEEDTPIQPTGEPSTGNVLGNDKPKRVRKNKYYQLVGTNQFKDAAEVIVTRPTLGKTRKYYQDNKELLGNIYRNLFVLRTYVLSLEDCKIET